MKYDDAHRAQYRALFASCQVDPPRKAEVESAITSILRGGKSYQSVSDATGVPWFVIGCLHYMECACSFSHHIHNGDPLSAQTKNVPADRPPLPWPVAGATPDELWQMSAIDAMGVESFEAWSDWTLAGILYSFERYNGFGYRSHGINSPYLWAASNHYTSGKYVSDGEWSETAVSKQIGAAVILRRMVDQSLVEIVQ